MYFLLIGKLVFIHCVCARSTVWFCFDVNAIYLNGAGFFIGLLFAITGMVNIKAM